MTRHGGAVHNIAQAIIEIIDAYGAMKRAAFESFVQDCERLQAVGRLEPASAGEFIRSLLQPQVDARIFEIVSFAILKACYAEQAVFWGWTPDALNEDRLVLYKTGRTNANDGGIDFVMKPLGRFFQVTETVSTVKYFLDIDKIQRYPFTFVVKSQESVNAIASRIEAEAGRLYPIAHVVRQYMQCIEEIVNIPVLLDRLKSIVDHGRLADVLDEIVQQGKVEFNYDE